MQIMKIYMVVVMVVTIMYQEQEKFIKQLIQEPQLFGNAAEVYKDLAGISIIEFVLIIIVLVLKMECAMMEHGILLKKLKKV